MAWNPVLAKAPDRVREPWITQTDEWRSWKARINRRGKPNTKRNLRMFTRALFRMYPDHLVSKLNEDDMRNFVDAISQKCARLLNGYDPSCRVGIGILHCPFMHGMDPTGCPKYQPLRIGGTWSYITSINQMYEWMREEQRITTNPMLPVMRDFRDRHRAEFDELANDPNRRDLTMDEVRLLAKNSPPNHAVVYFMAAKFFLRIHEALRMSFDPKYCNLEEGYMIIPAGLPNEPHKRKGNHRVSLDREAKTYLQAYHDTWWKANVACRADGTPVTQVVAITTFGTPWGVNGEGNFNKAALQADAERLKIMTGKEERGERVTTHAFRALACTEARSKGCPQIDEMILRGDKVGGAAGRYDNYLPRLPELYEKYGPKLNL